MKARHGLWILSNLLLGVGLQLLLVEGRRWMGLAPSGFPYVMALVLVPMTLPPLWLLLLGAAMGLLADTLYDTLGIHMAACVAMAYVCIGIQQRYTPVSLRELQVYPRASRMGWRWYSVYLLGLLLTHHLLVFLLEAGEYAFRWYVWRELLQSFVLTYGFFAFLELLRSFFGKER